MKRDAQATRQRILEAATAEFARYGIAGARIDRIAKASGSNKAMIYAYYHSKDQLFDAVFDALIVRNMNDVPVDVHDLAEYAARLFDQFQKYPEVFRIGVWDGLERGAVGMKTDAVVEANRHKVAEIRRAQEHGLLSATFPPNILLDLVIALTQTRPLLMDGSEQEIDHAERRRAIKDAVNALLRH
ncbi:TetR family transcriptional regulator [Deinococcus sp. QL22]|uniref:TetR family transcriptional regulator n=1 Tax=Deinococcus sp. QL22 TaxID=2939437 RepID=UPI0020171D96|nr:TetR family transcriptional regulator [Deinococcus sp. QL22]UQN10050.1 TetR family transcriptional regulator [Deinococcus sp. QL22]